MFILETLRCPAITSSRILINCNEASGVKEGVINCSKPVPIGTVAEYSCKEYYEPYTEEDAYNTRAVCQIDGAWSRNILKCEPGMYFKRNESLINDSVFLL